MSNAISASLVTALVVSLAAYESPDPSARPDREWQLTHDGVHAGKVRVPIPGWVLAAQPYACPPDLAVGPKGEAVVTSNVVPTLWRIDPATLAVTEHRLTLDADTDKDVGFSGLTYSPRHAAFFARRFDGSLWRIDTLLRRGERIAASQPVAKACATITTQSRRS